MKEINSDPNIEISDKSQTPKTREKVGLHSLDLIFQLTKEAIDTQLEQIDKFDGKGDSTQVSATTLIGAALVLEAVLLPLSNSIAIRVMQIALLLPLLIVYIIIMISTSMSYRISQYHIVPNPKTLTAKYLGEQEEFTKRRMLNVMISAYEENEIKINKKVKLINRAIMWRTIEAVILVAVLFTQVTLVLFTLGSK